MNKDTLCITGAQAAPERLDLGDYLTESVYPALFQRLDAALPEFGWRQREGAWTASTWPSDFPFVVDHPRPDRLVVYADRPWWIKIHGQSGVRLLDYANEGRRPKGEDFFRAVRVLCDRAGVPYPEQVRSPEEEKRLREDEARRAVLEDVAACCAEYLQSAEGEAARDYLRSERQLTDEEIRDFGVGLFPPVKDLQRMLRERGHAPEAWKDAHVLDRHMEGYLTVLAADDRGRPLTIHGRWPAKTPPLMKDMGGWCGKRGELHADWKRGDQQKPWDEPRLRKLNSLSGRNTRSCPLYLDRALRAGQREKLVAVEGLFDALLLQARGEVRAVAYIGSHFNGEQLKALVRRRVQSVVLCGDPDNAGDKGTLKNIEELSAVGIKAYVVPRLPGSVDPDEFVTTEGVEKWRALVEKAVHGFRYKAEAMLKEPEGGWTDAAREAARDAVIDWAATLPEDRDAEIAQYAIGAITQTIGGDAGLLVATVALRRRRAAGQAVPVDGAVGGTGKASGRGASGAKAKPSAKAQAKAGPGAVASDGLVTTSLNCIRPEPVRWLVHELIPLGKLTLLAGDGGHGKTTLTLELAAGVSKGRPVFGIPATAPTAGEVLLISCEDDFGDTIVPRLLGLGADLGKIHRVDGVRVEDGKPAPFSLAHYEALERELERHPAIRLVVIDPAGAYVGRTGCDDHKDSELRALLGPLAELAARRAVAILLVKHLNKGATAKAVHKVSGSAGYVNTVRAAFIVAPDPEDDDRKFFLPIKSNIGRKPQGFAYRLEAMKADEARSLLSPFEHLSDEDRQLLANQLFRPVWLGRVDDEADDVMGEAAQKGRGPTKGERAAEWLKTTLGAFAWPSEEVLKAGHKAGFTRNNLFTGKKLAGVASRKSRNHNGDWLWGIQDPYTLPLRPQPDTSDSSNNSVSSYTSDSSRKEEYQPPEEYEGSEVSGVSEPSTTDEDILKQFDTLLPPDE